MGRKLFGRWQEILFCARVRVRVYSSFVTAFVFAICFSRVVSATTYLDPQTSTRLENISNPKLQISLPAIDALSRSNDPAVVVPLSNALATEQNALVRRYLVDALGSLRQASGLPALQKALSDSNVQVRESAVAALGLIGTPQAQSILAAHAAQEKNPAVKRHYAHQLSFSALPASRQVLKTYQNDSDPVVQKIASQSMAMHPGAK